MKLIDLLEYVKIAFCVIYAAATVGVIVGVYWEGDQFGKEMQQRGWRLLVTSLAFDTLFTILIFSADGWISHIQRGEIIALETKAAPRSIEHDAAAAIVRAIKTTSLPAVRITYPDGDREALNYATQIAAVLKDGGCAVKGPFPESYLGAVFGLSILYGENIKPTDAGFLATVLRKNGFDVDIGAAPVPDPNRRDDLNLVVGTKRP
jgi:hypothetical protein